MSLKYRDLNGNFKELKVKTGDTLPIGTIVPFGGVDAPSGWLVCNGQVISRTTYSDLFNAIGTNYGSGDGSTTFALPDLRGKAIVGIDSTDTDFNTIGKTGGEKTHKLTVHELPEQLPVNYGGPNSGQGQVVIDEGAISMNGTSNGQINMLLESSGKSHNNLQPYQVTNYIIKAFQSVGVVSKVASTETNSNIDVYNCNYVNSFETKLTQLQAKIDNNIAYCKMSINDIVKIPADGVDIVPSNYIGSISYGGFVASTSDGYLFIPKGTEAVQLCGMVCGSGWCSVKIGAADGSPTNFLPLQQAGLLVQEGGDLHWKHSLPNTIIELDKDKDHYFRFTIGGVNGKGFDLNSGYGPAASWFGAVKIR